MTTLAVPVCRWWCSSASPVSGKSTFARTSLQADRGAVPAISAVALSPTTRTTRARLTTRSRSSISLPAKRRSAGRLTVVDATNVQPESRKVAGLRWPARHDVPAGGHRPRRAGVGGAVERNAARERTAVSAGTSLRGSANSCDAGLRGLKREGFRTVQRARRRRGDRRRHRNRADPALQRPAPRARDRSTLSATSTAAAANCVPC